MSQKYGKQTTTIFRLFEESAFHFVSEIYILRVEVRIQSFHKL
jgi:hypothetical protein